MESKEAEMRLQIDEGAEQDEPTSEAEACGQCGRSKKRVAFLLCLLLLVLLIIGLATGLGVAHSRAQNRGLVPPNPEVPLPPSRSVQQVFSKAAVCTDSVLCSEVGKNILQRNGSAVDAAVAAMFCNGVVNAQSMGLGGGFLMTIYLRDSRKAITLNAREVAPANISEDIFTDSSLTVSGPLSVAVPGELLGYWEAHKRYGRLPWSDVVAPTLKICKEGYHMSKHQYDSLHLAKARVLKDHALREMYVDPSTGKFYLEGTLIRPGKICDTLQKISEHGSDILYRGELGKDMVKDIQEAGGLVTEQDLANYRVQWEEPVSTTLHTGETVFSSPLPGSGALLALALNILDGFQFNNESLASINSTITTYHRVTEAFKFAMARRGELGDSNFVSATDLIFNLTSKSYAEELMNQIDDKRTSSDPLHYGAVQMNAEDHGTAHISVLAENGDAVSVTSSINFYFGAGFASPRTGIIVNSGMDDFSFPKFDNFFGIPPSESNRLEPGKRSMSSMTPTIVTSSGGDVRMVLGASGGTKILTANALVIMRHLWFGESIKEAVDAARFHHQVYPMKFTYEYGILQQVIEGLERLGHETVRYRERGSIICAIVKYRGLLYANADFRKGGEVFGY